MSISCHFSQRIAKSASRIAHVAGYLLNVFLQGILTVQFFKYYMDHSNDELIIKLTIYALCILEITHTAVTLYDGFTMLALQTEGTSGVNPLGISGYLLPAIIAFIAQCFYAFRIHRFSQRRWPAIAIALLSTIQLVLGILAGSNVIWRRWLVPTKSLGQSCNSALRLGWFAAFALCDITIAATMVTLLLKSRTRTRMSATRRLIKRVMRFSIETGAITTGASILCLVLVAVGEPYFLTVLLSLPKLYSITLLVQLNNRPKPHELQLDLTENEISFYDSRFK
ncbi:hypothetical protein F5887DRAFT_261519 [Amanita rubescens]|nr:hypothetical protein F5887DRAFT_261519 [Amanita rubescens]